MKKCYKKAFHDCVGHFWYGVLRFYGLKGMANFVHDVTKPKVTEEDQR